MTDIKCMIKGTQFRLAADAVLEWKGKIVLVKRKYPPFQGSWALPGGMVDMQEPVEETVKREVEEETRMKCRIKKLIGVYSALNRDPRGRTVAIAFHCQGENPPAEETEEAVEVKAFPLDKLPALAFDHEKIISDAKL